MTTESDHNQRSPAPASASAGSPRTPAAPRPRQGGRNWGAWLFTLLLVAGLAGAGWWAWQWYAREQQKLPAVQAALAEQALAVANLTRELTAERNERQQLAAHIDRTKSELQLQVDAQGKRLAELSSAGRDDWALAEAEYLLRLANQRLLTERQSKGALALMVATDTILRDLDDSALFPVRDALAREITALQVAGTVDREGIYLRLAALSEVIMQLQPTDFSENDGRDTAIDRDSQEDLPWYRQLVANARAAFDRFAAEHFRIKSLAKPLEPLLTPDQDVYLRHNVRLSIEQAQLALLREEQDVYTTSLEKAESWLRTYFSANADAEVVAEQLAALKTQVVVQKLPDVSGSLTALQAYVNRRHQLGAPPYRAESARPVPDATVPDAPVPDGAILDGAPLDGAPPEGTAPEGTVPEADVAP